MNYIIGDVHGELKALETVIDMVSKDDSDPHYHFLGDFIDRGPESKRVVDLVMSLKNASSIRGNHDDIFDKIINGESMTCAPADLPETELLWFMNYGMGKTLNSYGVKDKDIQDLSDAMDNRPSHDITNMFDDEDEDEEVNKVMEVIRGYIPKDHKKFFRSLPIIDEQSDYFMVHAYLFPHHDLATVQDTVNKQRAIKYMHDMVWGRFGGVEITGEKAWGKRGYFGHTPVKNYGVIDPVPLSGYSMMLLDTGATFEGVLTAYGHESGECFQSNKQGERKLFAPVKF